MTAKPKLSVLVLSALFACGGGGGSEPAKNASGDCPAGMVKQGGDCVAPEGQGGPGQASTATASSTSTASTASTASTSGSNSTPPDTNKTPYDKDSVEIVLRRAAGTVRASCGSASDENGKANGPWGTAKVQVRLGRNGHTRGVEVPERYAGKPVGDCMIHAFQNLVFPPYAAPADVVVEWDVELVRPPGS